MTRMLTLLALLFGPAMAGPVMAFDLDDLQQRLNGIAALQGRFEQQRYLADLDSRLSSSGRFVYERDTRVVWMLETPVEDRLEFTPDSAPQIGDTAGGGERRQNQVAALILRLLDGDWQALEERFVIELSGTSEDWRVTLTPKAEALRERLTQIRLSGARYLERLELQAANQDVLKVRFFDQRPLDAMTIAGKVDAAP